MQLRTALGELRDDIEYDNNNFLKENIFIAFRNVAQDELDAAEAGKNIGMAILSFISIITLIFYFFVKNALSVIRVSEHGKWFYYQSGFYLPLLASA